VRRREFLAGVIAVATAGSVTTPGAAGGPGGAGDGDGLARMDRNESPLGPSPHARRALAALGGDAGRYPDAAAAPVRAALARHLGVPEASVVPTCGSLEAIRVVLRAVVREGNRVVVGRPTFHWMPQLIADALAEPWPVALDAAGRHDPEALADAAAATRAATLVYLANPHNPTGSALPVGRIERLAASLPDRATLLVDEAYIEYAAAEGYASCVGLVTKHPRLVVLRTLSKAHGLAGLRVGCAVAPGPLARELARHRLSYGVSMAAERVVPEALADAGHVARAVETNRRVRNRLAADLAALGYRVYPSVASFVLCDLGADASRAVERLAGAGVLVHRPPDLPSCVRISVGSPADCARAARLLAARR
jgi:histidinol-phosphate aminotransferase